MHSWAGVWHTSPSAKEICCSSTLMQNFYSKQVTGVGHERLRYPFEFRSHAADVWDLSHAMTGK